MGFLFNGIHSSSMGIRVRLTDWRFIPAVNNYTVNIPGKEGVADFGASKTSRRISVKCGVNPMGSIASLIHALDALAAWLDPTNGTAQLMLDELPEQLIVRSEDDIHTISQQLYNMIQQFSRARGYFTTA